MSIEQKVLQSLYRHNETNIESPTYLLMDDESYFELKTVHFGSVELAIEVELEEYEGLKVFHNNIGNTFVHVD